MPGIGDTVFEMTEALRHTPLIEFSLWLTNTKISEWVQSHFFMVPILQMFHLFAIAMGFGSALMFNLRLLGVNGAGQTIAQASHRYLPWMWWSLVVLVISGIGMVLGDPVRLIVNAVFWIKIVLFLATLLFSILHVAVVSGKLKKMATWDGVGNGGAGIRFSAYFVLLLWACTMAGGRYMAYAPL